MCSGSQTSLTSVWSINQTLSMFTWSVSRTSPTSIWLFNEHHVQTLPVLGLHHSEHRGGSSPFEDVKRLGIGPGRILLTTSSPCIDFPHFLTTMAFYDIASIISQAVASYGAARNVCQVMISHDAASNICRVMASYDLAGNTCRAMASLNVANTICQAHCIL
jgi:hypothetical protein